MRRFIIQLIIVFSYSTVFADEEKKVIIIPVDKISDQKNYSSKDLQTIFNNYLKSYDGKLFWQTSAKKTEAEYHAPAKSREMSASPTALTGIYLPASMGGFENSSSSSLDLICYRCGLGKSDLVEQADCEKYKFKWNIQNMAELKKSCN